MPAEIVTRSVDQAKTSFSWWQRTRLARALRKFTLANGTILAGGITYRAVFSLVAALTISFTVFVRFVGDDEDLRQQVVETVNTAVPGLIDDGDTPGLLPVDALVMSSGMTFASIAASLILLWSVVTAMDSVRSSVRVMFSLPPKGAGAVTAKLRSFIGFVAVAAAVLLSSVAGVVLNSAVQFFDRYIDVGSLDTVLVTLGSYVVTVCLDMLAYFLVIRVLASIKVTFRDFLWGAGVVAVGFAIIRFLGTSFVVGSASNNALFASAAVIVTILIWLYLCARILLTAAAITANPPLYLLDTMADETTAHEAIQAARMVDAAGGVDAVESAYATEHAQKSWFARPMTYMAVGALIGLVVKKLLSRQR
ncbi:YihY/virulence factor BrkB family protein [Timonella sp. A28]|uniref:YihY/virulence factor BrkB family protein n=1 Tax=Timonella sp. A28 TaxID=3442640 RepID=UPI003EB6F0F3